MPACPRCGQDNPEIARLCLACGDNPHFVASQGVGNNQEPVLHHAKKNQAILAVVFAVIHEVDCEWVFESLAGLLETHAVLREVRSSLVLVHSKSSLIIDTDYP